MSTAVALITEQVRERVRRDGVDLGGDRQGALVDRYVREEVRRYSERALGGSLPMLHDEHQAAREIVASITGFGVLQPFFDDPEIEEIWINGPSKVFIARNGVPELTSVLLSDTEVRDLVERMLQSTGRRVDLSSPFVDASLPDVIYPRRVSVHLCKLKKNLHAADRASRKLSATWSDDSSRNTKFVRRCYPTATQDAS